MDYREKKCVMSFVHDCGSALQILTPKVLLYQLQCENFVFVTLKVCAMLVVKDNRPTVLFFHCL